MILLALSLLLAPLDEIEARASLNDGARVTNSSTVQLRVRVLSPMPPGLEMSISDGAWRPYTESQPVELPAGDGEKTVVVKLRDAAGQERGVYKASILLDTTPPEAKVSGPVGTVAGMATLTSDVPDATAMQWTEDATRWGPWVPYLNPRDIPLSPGDGVKTLLVRYRDEAGNVSKPATLRLEQKHGPDGSDEFGLWQVKLAAEPGAGDRLAITLGMPMHLRSLGMFEMSVQVDQDKPLPREPFTGQRLLEMPRTGGAHRIRLVLFDKVGGEHPVEVVFLEADVQSAEAGKAPETPAAPTLWSLSVQGGLLPSAIDFLTNTPTGFRKINKDALGLARLSLSREIFDPLYAQVGLEYAGGGGIRVYSGTLDMGARLFSLGTLEVAAEAGLIYSDLKVTESAFGDFDAALGFRGGIRARVDLGDRLSVDATVDYRRIAYDYAEPIVSGDRAARLQTVGLLLGLSLKF